MNYWRGSLILQAGDYFLLGIDSHYQTFIDLGGHYEPADGHIIRTAFREFQEESLGVFGNFSIIRTVHTDSHDGQFVLILEVPTIYLSTYFLNEFETRKSRESSVEVSALRWLSRDNLVSRLLNQPDDFYIRTWLNLYIFLKKDNYL